MLQVLEDIKKKLEDIDTMLEAGFDDVAEHMAAAIARVEEAIGLHKAATDESPAQPVADQCSTADPGEGVHMIGEASQAADTAASGQ